MDFRSDNISGVAPEILDAIAQANHGTVGSYGDDPHTAKMTERFGELFEREVEVFPVSTGIAANGLALSACTTSYGLIYCHETAHIDSREGGAAEFFTGGAKLVPLTGSDYKIDPRLFAQRLDSDLKGITSKAPPCALSLTQATDWGTVYRPEEVQALASAAHGAGLKVHMDGARFANAVASLGVSPADLSWRSGVDIMSFGATKNGGMSADAIVLFDASLARDLRFRLRRAGQVASKMRFASAQLERYVRDGLWLRLAAHANAAARELAGLLEKGAEIELAAAVEANAVFARVTPRVIDRLQKAGARFHTRPDGVIRLVCSFNTPSAAVQELARIAVAARSAA